MVDQLFSKVWSSWGWIFNLPKFENVSSGYYNTFSKRELPLSKRILESEEDYCIGEIIQTY